MDIQRFISDWLVSCCLLFVYPALFVHEWMHQAAFNIVAYDDIRFLSSPPDRTVVEIDRELSSGECGFIGLAPVLGGVWLGFAAVLFLSNNHVLGEVVGYFLLYLCLGCVPSIGDIRFAELDGFSGSRFPPDDPG